MRLVFVGATTLAVVTAKALVEAGHQVVIIDRDRALIDELSSKLDCSLLNGDGSTPDILKEADPANTDILFCTTNHDQTNIIASLAAKSLGYHRVVTIIQDEEFESICQELGLKDTIIPVRTIGRQLMDLVEGHDTRTLSEIIKYDATLFSFRCEGYADRTIADLEIPKGARVIGLYREKQLILADTETALENGDEIIILTQRDKLEKLRERFTVT